jgi:hypothetical protein
MSTIQVQYTMFHTLYLPLASSEYFLTLSVIAFVVLAEFQYYLRYECIYDFILSIGHSLKSFFDTALFHRSITL